MKTILLLTILFLSVQQASAQAVDSSKLYTYGLSVRAGDIEDWGDVLIVGGELTEDPFAMVRAKYKAQNNPSGATLVTLDSVRNDVLIEWYNNLVQTPTGLTAASHTRLRTAFKTTPVSPYVIRINTERDAFMDAVRVARSLENRRRFKGQRN